VLLYKLRFVSFIINEHDDVDDDDDDDIKSAEQRSTIQQYGDHTGCGWRGGRACEVAVPNVTAHPLYLCLSRTVSEIIRKKYWSVTDRRIERQSCDSNLKSARAIRANLTCSILRIASDFV